MLFVVLWHTDMNAINLGHTLMRLVLKVVSWVNETAMGSYKWRYLDRSNVSAAPWAWNVVHLTPPSENLSKYLYQEGQDYGSLDLDFFTLPLVLAFLVLKEMVSCSNGYHHSMEAHFILYSKKNYMVNNCGRLLIKTTGVVQWPKLSVTSNGMAEWWPGSRQIIIII